MSLVTATACLAVLVLLDGAFAGFRASCGRTGLVRHTRADRVAAARGVLVLGVLVLPAGAVALTGLLGAPGRAGDYGDAARDLLAVLGPYGLLVLAALAAYLGLGWRHRFLASAVLLGPLTLVRPVVVVVAVGVAVARTPDAFVVATGLLATAAVLGVEPLVGRAWYAAA